MKKAHSLDGHRTAPLRGLPMIRAVVFDAGECPVAVVGTADQQDLARLVDDDHVDGRDEAASVLSL
jgi:hypothetical protein